MVTEDEWTKMKASEYYGMYAALAKELSYMKAKIDILESRVDKIATVVK